MVYQGDKQAYRELFKQVSLLLFSPRKENNILLYWRKDLLYLELQANAWNFEMSWYFREKIIQNLSYILTGTSKKLIPYSLKLMNYDKSNVG